MTSGRVCDGPDVRVPRRATALLADRRETRPLHEWRDIDAYVLLGDPGAGKSESLRAEALACAGVYRSARDFIALGVEPASAGKTLFIDGLDEMRAGSADGRVPLDAIRASRNGPCGTLQVDGTLKAGGVFFGMNMLVAGDWAGRVLRVGERLRLVRVAAAPVGPL